MTRLMIALVLSTAIILHCSLAEGETSPCSKSQDELHELFPYYKAEDTITCYEFNRGFAVRVESDEGWFNGGGETTTAAIDGGTTTAKVDFGIRGQPRPRRK